MVLRNIEMYSFPFLNGGSANIFLEDLTKTFADSRYYIVFLFLFLGIDKICFRLTNHNRMENQWVKGPVDVYKSQLYDDVNDSRRTPIDRYFKIQVKPLRNSHIALFSIEIFITQASIFFSVTLSHCNIYLDYVLIHNYHIVYSFIVHYKCF